MSTPQLLIAFTGSIGGPARLQSLQNRKSGFDWAAANRTTEPVFVSEHGSEAAWTINHSSAGHDRDLRIDYASAGGLTANQRCRLLTDIPILEFRCDFQNTGAQAVSGVRAFGPFRIPLKTSLGALQVHAIRRNSYAVERIPLDQELELRGGRWNMPEHAGLIVLEAQVQGEFLVVGIEWERGWRYRLSRKDDTVWLEVDLSDLRHDLAPGASLSSPAVFLGLTGGDVDDAFGLAQQYLKSHVFPKPVERSPWIVYDIWGTESKGVEEALLNEIGFAAELGVELFYVDASWYAGSSKKGNGDWGCGLGNYTEDREKFPHGLAYMADQLHARGMKFGLWIGPNIVDSRLVPDTIHRRWLAQLDGADRVLRVKGWEAPCNQVCLGCTEYIEHLKTAVTRLVQDFHLDWLKWDNSGIPGMPGQCNRADHGHQAGDGSYAALRGQYEVFRHLHDSFPELVLEQCGYGSRLDYGLARTIRANWLSDASFPSTHVRDNALVASYIYPSFYNGGWVIKDPELEKTKDPEMLDTIYRSRMIGLFGFGTLHGTLPERISLFPAEVQEAGRRNMALYKKYRHLLHGRAYHSFPSRGSPEQWQAIQFASDNGAEAVLLCFRGSSTQSQMRLPVRGLQRSSIYRLTNANGGQVRSLSGHQLMRDGIIASLPKAEMSDIFFMQS